MSTQLSSIKAHGREITVTQFSGGVNKAGKGILKFQVQFGIDKGVVFKDLSNANAFAKLISKADEIL